MIARAKRLLAPLGGVLLALVVWNFVAISIGDTARLIPTPMVAVERCVALLMSGDINADIEATLWRWLTGFILAVAVGAPAGLFVGASEFVRRSLSIVIDFLRSLPVTALFPVFLVFFGVGNTAMIAMSFSATVFIIIVHAVYGIQSAPLTRANMARSFGARPWQIFWRISAMEALHHIFVGMRTTLSLSLIVAVVSEMFIGASHGLGQRLYLSYQLSQVGDLYALILIVGTLGMIANWLFSRLERRTIYWIYP